VQRIGTTEIHGSGAGSVHDKLAGRGPDRGMDGAFLEGNAFAVAHSFEKADASAGVDLNLADFRDRDGCARSRVGDE